MAKTAGYSTIFCGFSSLMDIDKLILQVHLLASTLRFSSLMDIDKLILCPHGQSTGRGFSSLMDIDKLIKRLLIYTSLCPNGFSVYSGSFHVLFS